MLYKLPNGKNIRIDDEYLRKQMAILHLSEDEAIQMYLEDEGYEVNPEQEALEQKAKENRITATIHQARAYKPKTQRERVVKPDPTKEDIIAKVAQYLVDELGCSNVQIVNKSKIITFDLGEDEYKIDLTRKNKKLAEKKAKGK